MQNICPLNIKKMSEGLRKTAETFSFKGQQKKTPKFGVFSAKFVSFYFLGFGYFFNECGFPFNTIFRMTLVFRIVRYLDTASRTDRFLVKRAHFPNNISLFFFSRHQATNMFLTFNDLAKILNSIIKFLQITTWITLVYFAAEKMNAILESRERQYPRAKTLYFSLVRNFVLEELGKIS